MLKSSIKNVIYKSPKIKNIFLERDILRKEVEDLKNQLNNLQEEKNELLSNFEKLKSDHHEKVLSENHIIKHFMTWVPIGHFYSPYADIEKIKKREKEIYNNERKILDIELNLNEQLEFLKEIESIYPSIPFKEKKQPQYRYHYDKNFAYSYADAITLHSTIRILKPKRIIEIGSGYSSAVTLDTNEFFFKNKIECTFIEPYPELLYSLMKKGDKKLNNILVKNLEEIDINLFSQLEENDILFCDSTHVSKVDSDVNYIFFEILPRLKKGVYIHFHDIFYPFEYPKEWIYEGRAWQEDYLLRAFLMYNNSYKIKFWAAMMYYKKREYIKSHIPLFSKNPGGNFWIQKVR